MHSTAAAGLQQQQQQQQLYLPAVLPAAQLSRLARCQVSLCPRLARGAQATRNQSSSCLHAQQQQQQKQQCYQDWHQQYQRQQQQQQQWPLQARPLERCRPHRTAVAVAPAAAASDQPVGPADGGQDQQQQQPQEAGATAAGDGGKHRSQKAVPIRIAATSDEETYSLKDTKVLVETAMLSAVSGLAFLLSTLLKLDNSLGYFLPLPIAIAACRSGVGAAWHTMMATAFLLLVLLGPLRAITYVLMHGMLAAALGSMWVWRWPWAASIPAGAVLRMAGQLGYLVLSSVTMNENLFAVMLANVHNLLDRLSAALGSSGSASTLTISCMIFALLLVNGICYVFLLHVVYHVILSSMGFKMGPLPGFVRKYLYAGAPPPSQQAQQATS